METMQHAVNWIEIPVTDFDRAMKFYSAIYDYEMQEHPMDPSFRMGFLSFEMEKGGIGGAIVHGEGYVPSKEGSKVYLNGGSDLNAVLNRIEGAGGSVVMPKTEISPEIGFFAIFEDTEGNHISLHSQK